MRLAAYWVSGVGVRGGSSVRGDKGTVDVTTLARADRVRIPTDYAKVDTNKAVSHDFTGRDFMGPNPATWGFDEWLEQGITFEPGPEQPVENGFDATFTGVAAVTLDLDRMSLDAGRELTLRITGDGPTSLTLRGGSSSPMATRSQSSVTSPAATQWCCARPRPDAALGKRLSRRRRTGGRPTCRGLRGSRRSASAPRPRSAR